MTLLAVLTGVVTFAAGWWVGRTTTRDIEAGRVEGGPGFEVGLRLGRIEEELDALKARVDEIPSRAGPLGPNPDRIYEIAVGDSPALGADDAAVTIVEFSDFECPYCASAGPTLDRILAEYEGRVRLVFKHHPLPIHPQAILAHKAAVAAGREEKFWEMHDLLFASQEMLDRASLKMHAATLGLDPAAFEQALESPRTEEAIRADQEEARRLHILGVPSFFVGGRFIAGAQPFEVFQERIEEALRGE